MSYLLRLLLATLLTTNLLGQGWYQLATPTNSLSCLVTNVGFTPTSYNVYRFVTNGVQRYQSPVNPVPYTNFLAGVPTGIYSLQITVIGVNAKGVVEETLPSTNIYVYWQPPPSVPGGPVALTTR